MIYLISAVAGLAGFLFGFDEGIIAGALSLLRADFGIDPVSEGVMTSAVPFGALLGSLFAGWLGQSFGRRPSLLVASLLFVAGAALATLATSPETLTAARLVLGLAIGIAAIVAPLYISENAPASKRGMLVSIYQLAITLGILGAYLVALAFSESWRIMFAFGAVPGLALAVGIYMLADTPRWLASRGRLAEARVVIARVQATDAGHPSVEREFRLIADAAAQPDSGGQWAGLFAPFVRPALTVAVGLFVLQQLSGINAVIYFAPTVFKEAGFGSHSTQLLATIGVGVVNVLMTLVGMVLIDKLGRRKLLLIGFCGAALSLGLIAVAAATEAASLDVLAFAGLAIYIASFAVSIGPLPWVVMSEIFPLSVRTAGMSLASVANWSMNFLVVFSFPPLVAMMGISGVFALYALACVIGVIFTRALVPETAGIALEAIESHLRSGKPLRQLGTASISSTEPLRGESSYEEARFQGPAITSVGDLGMSGNDHRRMHNMT